MRRFVLLGVVLIVAACGSSKSGIRHVAFRPGAFEPSLRVSEPLPGTRVRRPRDLPDEVVRSSVRELVATGHRSKRLALRVARTRAGMLCVGAGGEWECLGPADAQPVFAFTLQGGHRVIRDFGAVAGLAAPDVRVSVERRGHEVRLPLHRFPHFGWAAFVSPVWTNGAPDLLHFYDRKGHELSGFIDLAFVADPCAGKEEHQRGESRDCRAPREWSHIGDPLGEASGADDERVERAKEIAFADPLVRKLLAGRRYSFSPATAWSKCNGEPIGVILGFHIAPAKLAEDWPAADYQARSRTAYVQSVTYYEVSNVTELQVSVDTNRGKVVGIDPTMPPLRGAQPKVNEFSFHPVGRPVPAGGPDNGKCSSEGD